MARESTRSLQDPTLLSDANILHLMRDVTVDQAEKMGIYLGLSSARVNSLKRQTQYDSAQLYAHKTVVVWRDDCISDSTSACRQLAKVLRDCDLRKKAVSVLKLVYTDSSVIDEIMKGNEWNTDVESVEVDRALKISDPPAYDNSFFEVVPVDVNESFMKKYYNRQWWCCHVTLICTVFAAILVFGTAAGLVNYNSSAGYAVPIQKGTTVKVPISYWISSLSMKIEIPSSQTSCSDVRGKLYNLGCSDPQLKSLRQKEYNSTFLDWVYLLEGTKLNFTLRNKNKAKLKLLTDENEADYPDFSQDVCDSDPYCFDFDSDGTKDNYMVKNTSFYFMRTSGDERFNYSVKGSYYPESFSPTAITIQKIVKPVSLRKIFDWSRRCVFIHMDNDCSGNNGFTLVLGDLRIRTEVYILAAMIAAILFAVLCITALVHWIVLTKKKDNNNALEHNDHRYHLWNNV